MDDDDGLLVGEDLAEGGEGSAPNPIDESEVNEDD